MLAFRGLRLDGCWLSPALLVEVAGERLTVDLFGEVVLPPQDAVPVLLVVALAGRNVGTLRQKQRSARPITGLLTHPSLQRPAMTG